jgi:hypothetical protein
VHAVIFTDRELHYSLHTRHEWGEPFHPTTLPLACRPSPSPP